MRLSEVKQMMREQGKLDDRELLCYAKLAGTIQGASFQNLVAVIFSKDTLDLYHANIDGSVGESLISVPYASIKDFQLKHRFWYSYTSFSAPSGSYRFYNYDKHVFIKGFRDATLLEGAT